MNEERTPANGWRTNDERCPHCNTSLQGDPIPEKYLAHDVTCNDPNTCFCLPYGKVTHFGRTIGVEVRGVYDGVLYWRCPDCGGAWHRWDIPDMRARAERYM